MSLSILQSLNVPESPGQWLDTLRGPTFFWLPGPEELPARALSVLLHGNERSGLVALHRYLAEGRVPARRTLCFVSAVEAALCDPSKRVVPGRRDLNRCFFGPFDDANGALAESILARLRDASPEALIDLHNNSGDNPSFGVLVDVRPTSLALVEFFTKHAVLNTLALGTLVEAQVEHCPSVVIECGQGGSPIADEVAFQGLCRYLEVETLSAAPEQTVQVFRNTVRFEIRPGVRPIFVHPGETADGALTLRADLETFNFRTVPCGEVLGWSNEAKLALLARDGSGVDRIGDYLALEDGEIRAIRDFKPIMISTRPDVVLDDCLCYLIEGLRS